MEKIADYSKYQLSRSQQEILNFEIESYAGTDINIVNFRIWLKSDFSDECIIKALKHLVRNEQALRLRFFPGETVYQQEESYVPFEIPASDYGNLSHQEIEEILDANASPSIRCNDYPLFRFSIHRTTKEVVTDIHIHHLIMDGIAIMLFCNKFVHLCHCIKANREVNESSPAFTQFLQKLESRDVEEIKEEDKAYWQYCLKDWTELCRIRPNKAWKDELSGKRLVVTWDENDGAALSTASRESGIQPGIWIEAALAYCLYKQNTGRKQVELGIMTSGRKSFSERELFGNCAEEIIHCIPVEEEWTVKEFLQVVAGVFADAYRHSSWLHDDVLVLASTMLSREVEFIRDIEFGFIPYFNKYGERLNTEWSGPSYPETTIELLVIEQNKDEFTFYFNYRTAMFTDEEATNCLTELLNTIRRMTGNLYEKMKNINV